MFTIDKYRRFVFATVCGVLLFSALIILAPWWSAFAWAIALAVILSPLNLRLRSKVGKTAAAALATTAVLVVLVAPLLIVFAALRNDIAGFIETMNSEPAGLRLQALFDDANELIRPIVSRFGVEHIDIRDGMRQLVESALANAPEAMRSLTMGTLNFVFALVLLFFLLRDGEKLKKPAIEVIPLPAKRAESVLASVYDTIHATFYGIAIVAIVQGTLLGLAFWVLGLPAPLAWGMLTVLLCLIPFVGAPFVWVPTSLWLAYRGRWLEAAGLALFGAFVIGLVDNVFRPLIIGARVRLPFVAVFVAIAAGILSFGPIGILVGPVLLSVNLGAIEVLREMNRPD